MSVVLKNVLHSRCRQGKMPDFNVKRFFALSRNTKSPISKREGMKMHDAHCFVFTTMRYASLYILERRGFIVSLTHLLLGVWRCLYFDGLKDCNSLRLFCALAYRLLTKINKWFAKMKNKDIFANKLNLLLCHYSE